MLPERHHPADTKWIKSQLDKLPPDARAKAVLGYAAVYMDAWDEIDSFELRKDNHARRTANLRLLDYVEKHQNMQQ